MKELSTQDHLYLWSQILGSSVSLHQCITSPFRADKNPGCFLRESKGIVMFTDYAQPEYSKFTILHAINYFRNKGLNDAAMQVFISLYFNKPLNLNLHLHVTIGDKIKGRKSDTKIHFNSWLKDGKPAYTKWDKEYWEGTGVTEEDLRNSNIQSVHHFYVNEKMITPPYPCYSYYKNGRTKIYTPKNPKGERFLGNTNANDIWKWNEGNDKLLITKSVKDGLILSKQLDWEIWAFNNEGVIPNDIETNTKDFKQKVILYDNDSVGIRQSTKLAEIIGARCVYFTKAKDAYDLVKQFGLDALKEELKLII